MFQDTQPAVLSTEGGIDPWSEFRVEHPREQLDLLRQLRDGGHPVGLNAPGGLNLSTQLWALDEHRQRLNFRIDNGAPQWQAMVQADEVVAVAYLDSIKLQFDLHDLMLVHGAQTSTLQAAWPAELYRLQRRRAYRVRPPERARPQAELRHPSLPDMLLRLRVVDVSIGGCALLVPHDVPALQPGTRVAGVRLALDLDTRFDAGLVLQHVSDILPGQQGVRIGCEWLDLPGPAQRSLQRYIDQTQKRRRLLSLS